VSSLKDIQDKIDNLNEVLTKVTVLAREEHRNQMYLSFPYGYHLNHVKNTFCEIFKSITIEEKIVIECHDLVEDTDVTLEKLSSLGVPNNLIKSIDLLTKKKNQSRSKYIKELKTNYIAKRVKIADSTSNLIHSLRSGESRRIEKYCKNLRELND
jgi:sugar-specific transcriptional regulator TrmB